jgi:hypothetical protein
MKDVPWAVVGAELIERFYSSWSPTLTYGAVKKIDKVYKNGNFIVEGSAQQWAPVNSHASRTGRDGYYSSTRTNLVPLTDAVRADIAQAKAYQAAVKVLNDEIERLQELARSRDVDATIAEATAINAAEAS